MVSRTFTSAPVAAVAASMLWASPASASVDREEAQAIFDEAKEICERDGGRFWAVSLCGPMFLTDWQDRRIIANQADRKGSLVPEGKLWVGQLGEDVIIANTPTEWSGTRWTQMVPPLSPDIAARRVTIAHELFHRIQGQLGLDRGAEGKNRHLDTLEGRYLMQLEWRALRAALLARTREARNAAILDAIALRQERYRRFPGAGDEEALLEIGEGIPEYTGVMLGLDDASARQGYALHDLEAFTSARTFVRSFAYATGPAWGILLDWTGTDWRSKIAASRFDVLMLRALSRSADVRLEIGPRIEKYDPAGALRSAEQKRENDRLALLQAYRSRLIEGPVLRLPLGKSNFQFNPQTLVPLDDQGIIYPSMRLTDTWGALTVEDGGVLIRDHPREATVSAVGADRGGLTGAGWKLELAADWTVRPGERDGDLDVVPSSSRRLRGSDTGLHGKNSTEDEGERVQ